MKEEGFDINQIIKITNLSVEENREFIIKNEFENIYKLMRKKP